MDRLRQFKFSNFDLAKMAAICQECTLKLKDNQLRIDCRDCGRVFHASCCNVSAADLHYLRDEGLGWKCSRCLQQAKTSRNVAPDGFTVCREQDAGSQALTIKHFDELMGAINLLREDNRQFRSRLDDLKLDLDSCKRGIAEARQLFESAVSECRSDIDALKDSNLRVNEKIRDLESRIADKALTLDNAIFELNERRLRQDNIVLHGLKEDLSAEDGSDSDGLAVREMFDVLGVDVDTFRVQRLGRHGEADNPRPRPLRVVLSSSDIVAKLLRKSSRLKTSHIFRNVYLSPDRTPHQLELHKTARAELRRRMDAGEMGLRIRTVNGLPTVVSGNRASRNGNLN